MSNKFIKESFDKFKEATTREHIGNLKYEIITISLRRFTEGNKIDSILLDYVCRSDGYFCLENGDLRILVDGKVITLSAHESNYDVRTEEDSAVFYEYGFYQISKEQLKLICDASSVELRFTGDSQYLETPKNWNSSFQIYCQQFYNGVIDSSLYPSSINKNVSSGCFIATATLGDDNNPIVVDLRAYRDNHLEKSFIGRVFITLYYRFSVIFVPAIRQSELLRTLSLHVLIKPLHRFIRSRLLHK